ncbi:helix-turn-helix domain-containing protein [Micromonospora sp. MH33]|uniref:helix-turn-helix domain-containing protein n=1 Tax=Micromonospora sp. MH33 TaxID=1945509 RepID=UPI001FEFD02F|nr:helix-turn-helix domain-containing protein [Micromonospora sp. MH33]
MAEACQRLGRQLAAWRDLAGLTQVELARRINYSRSAIGNVEIGRDRSTRRFWQSADAEVGAGGALVASFDQVDALARDFRRQTAGYDLERERRTAPVVAASMPRPDGCGCGAAFGRWTGREVRALREALRMTVSTFAEHIGVTGATVSGWERRAKPAPLRMAMQVALDEALALAGVDAKTRFRLILTAPTKAWKSRTYQQQLAEQGGHGDAASACADPADLVVPGLRSSVAVWRRQACAAG